MEVTKKWKSNLQSYIKSGAIYYQKAVILSFGCSEEEAEMIPLEEFRKRCDYVRSHIISEDIKSTKHPVSIDGFTFEDYYITLRNLMDLLNNIDEEYPKELSDLIKKEKKMSTKEKETLLKIIAAMAKESYNFDPSQKKSSCTTDILNALININIEMDPGTIKDKLKQCEQFIPGDCSAQ